MLVTGAALGSWRGASSLTLYLVAGMFLPVFAGQADGYIWQAGAGEYVFGFSSGSSGFFWQIASGGYIIGFVAAAWLVGFLCERGLGSSVWDAGGAAGGERAGLRAWPDPVVAVRAGGEDAGVGAVPVHCRDLIKLFLAAMLVPAAYGLVNFFRGEDYNGGGGYGDRWL